MSSAPHPVFFDAETVRARLTWPVASSAVRHAMIGLSSGEVRQLLRSFISVGEDKTFAIMPAALMGARVFGAKLVAVFGDGTGRRTHEGVVVLFEGEGGAPVCVADAGEVTAIRTAAASAVATQALAAPDADRLAVIGIGRQAAMHIEAIAAMRDLKHVSVWGRDPGRTDAFVQSMAVKTGLHIETALSVEQAVRDASIVCTVTGARDPILKGAWIGAGVHVNVVGSSNPLSAEIDADLVARSRFIVDHREHVLAHGGEFLRAKAAGLIDDQHIAGEIGDVLAGRFAGRENGSQITIYKSLGHAAQDLAVVEWMRRQTDSVPAWSAET